MGRYRNSDILCVFCLAATLAATGGCGSSTARGTDVTPEYDKQTGRLRRIASDSNRDGKIDTWGYMDGARIIRVEVDEDGDGRVDRWEYFPEAPAPGSTGVPSGPRPPDAPERIERATRHDGKVSRWEYFDHGVLDRVEEDTDGDGQLDKWETYRGGTLAELAIDTEHRGKPSRRLLYKPDGSLDRIETDPTGSGKFVPLNGQKTAGQ